MPDQYIHEELDGDVIQRFLDWRKDQIVSMKRNFGVDARDPQNYFIILDDCVDQNTRYDKVMPCVSQNASCGRPSCILQLLQ